ncbi:zinc finger protein CONSTANS-LIKE 6-like [Chenopodium quinoa]|uniref:zinc finger protein CONSTANS-LIKE 6-like n=1 Tax=Chenopodium quinoa TaxID=63459 RepID=UPI000B771361|nr:zinc finger protein CONSTANS-LIKE 6-like [Chenopodium quinoa]
MSTHCKKTANAVGGKTARACESCLKRRARWFCAADDAFLCQACDSSVHSANELASRHNRVRLESKLNPQPSPSWHQGFTKKARTPRGNNNAKTNKPSYNNYEMRVVPEVCNEDDDDEGSIEEDRNEAVFSVPNLEVNDPFEIKEFKNSNNNKSSVVEGGFEEDDFNISLIGFEGDNNNEWENYLPAGFLPSDNDLAEFAADVESLIEHEATEEGGKGGDEEADDELQLLFPGVKIEEEGDISATTDHCYFDWSIDVESEMFNFDLNQTYGNNSNHDQSQVSGVEEDEEEDGKKVVVPKHEATEVEEELEGGKDVEANNKRRKILLRLNYDEVINAWASQGCLSPWTTGRRPEFEFDHHGWPYCMGGMFPTGVPHPQGEGWMGMRGNANGGDEGREARVSRYREKRRTRLFSKKIRYEVRKLNAEKRPRLKGRFVKRTSLSQVVGVGVEPTFPNYHNK